MSREIHSSNGRQPASQTSGGPGSSPPVFLAFFSYSAIFFIHLRNPPMAFAPSLRGIYAFIPECPSMRPVWRFRGSADAAPVHGFTPGIPAARTPRQPALWLRGGLHLHKRRIVSYLRKGARPLSSRAKESRRLPAMLILERSDFILAAVSREALKESVNISLYSVSSQADFTYDLLETVSFFAQTRPAK
jgi:hypothetical protein